MRCTALLAAHAGRASDVEPGLRAAIDLFASLGYPYWHARAQHDLGTWLARTGRNPDAEALLRDARATYRRLGIQAVGIPSVGAVTDA